MQTRDIFANISPLDHRYSRDEDDYAEISKYLSEKATIALQAEVELALIKVLAARGLAPQTAPAEVEKAIAELTTAEVYAEEAKTKHNIRALVNCLQKKVSKKCRPFLHFTATSYDIVDTANSLRYQKTARELILPRLKNYIKAGQKLPLEKKIGFKLEGHMVSMPFPLLLVLLLLNM